MIIIILGFAQSDKNMQKKSKKNKTKLSSLGKISAIISVVFLLEAKISRASLVGNYMATDTSGLPYNTGGVIGVVTNVADFLLGLIGLVAVIAFVIAGFQYLTAYGDEKVVEKAKHTMTYAVMGLAVVLLAVTIIMTVDALLR